MSASVHAGISPPKQTPPGADTPLGADTPQSRHPLGPDTPLEQTPPTAETPPHSRHPPQQNPPSTAGHAGRYGQRAGGTHPTGMQSCVFYFILQFLYCMHWLLLVFPFFASTKQRNQCGVSTPSPLVFFTNGLMVSLKKPRVYPCRLLQFEGFRGV